MDQIAGILAFLASAAKTTTEAATVAQAVIGYVRNRNRNRRTAEVVQFLKDLGQVSEADVRGLVERWDPPGGASQELKAELVVLLTNLVRGARFHTTQGTPLSGYLRCERLIEQLVRNLQPKRRAGERLPGGWELKRFLGMGGFGEVWVGAHRLHPDRRAFKFFTDPAATAWFEREGAALHAVQRQLAGCPNVTAYVDVALDAKPHPYLVLELVDGGSLEEWVTTPPADRPPLDIGEVVRGVVRGLALAHRHHICHRDLKPANILLTAGPDPVPKIADFGLSRVEPEAAGGSGTSTQGVVVGTRMYLPPEAADPYEPRRPAQDDVFAVGVVWYQLLTGRLDRPPYDFADRLLQAGVDARTGRLVARCLAHPDRRFRDAGELEAELDAEAPPGPGEWEVPADGLEVAPLVREYLDRAVR